MRGEMLAHFCKDNKFTIKNKWYRLPPPRLYTWKGPRDDDNNLLRNQIDFNNINLD